MRRLVYMSVLAACAGSICLSPVIAQNLVTNSAIQTGYAVITPLSGDGLGLSVVETFGELVSGNLFQASVLPSPLVTLTNLIVNLDLQSGVNTGIAIVNPNEIPATISFSMVNAQGVDTGVRAVIIGGRQQFSRFVSDLFPEIAVSGPFSGFLVISSDITIAVLGLQFDGLAFSALPIASQSGADTRSTFVFTPTVVLNTPIVSPTGFVAATTFSTQALPSTIPPPALPSTLTQLPSTIAGLAVTEPVTGITTPIGTTTEQLPVLTFSAAAIGVGVTTPFPVIDTAVGGPGAFVLPQIAAGGGWVSQITIANTTTAPQVVRMDFFNRLGGPLVLPFGPSIPSVVIPAASAITISTAR